nr:MAG TPA: hypothetical protein [Caudoviricetes sp.]
MFPKWSKVTDRAFTDYLLTYKWLQKRLDLA